MLKGITIDYMTDSYVYQEALTSVKKFIKQRSRWVQGDLDCVKYLPRIIKSKVITGTQKIGIYYFLIQPWLNLLADVTIIALVIFMISDLITAGGDVITSLQAIIVVIVLLAFSCLCGFLELTLYYIDLNHFHELKPPFYMSLGIVLMISYVYVILFFSILRAYWRWFHHQETWIKTDHADNLPDKK